MPRTIEIMCNGPPPGIHSALAGLLRDLPTPGPWDAAKKKEFLNAFTGIFDFVYPAKEKQQENQDD